MAVEFGTDAWAQALQAAIDGSSEYRNAAKSWGVGFPGNVLLVFRADDRLAETKRLLLRLEGGRCSGAEIVDTDDHPDAAYSLTGDFSLWHDVLTGKTLAATAILAGKITVTGNKMKLLAHAPSHRAMVHCVGSVDTEYP